ncbi:alpha/beta fold hydrolase [Histidinibacterium aquaticum]|uniref:Alpha/beta fold hydrolase n=1 Tax=Histidinibacterium aquaticum TaxID=2613962 RepID=A0A5J5GIU9_9RHOB|nr:alpha/beta fold hydrolase [Histidinibacterium aquaticum]KAA9008169.1 alpha/beta fold hydrolase [Histidinibacterium aquaticum]
MSRIVLVHGSGHGAWCWEAVLPHLRAAGHDPVAVDMPGRGANALPLEEATLDDFADACLAAAGDGAVLVGHSAGGYAITAAAQARPDLVDRLIYVCAFVPEPGTPLSGMRRLMNPPPLSGAIRKAPDGRSYTVDPEQAPALFYNDLPEAEARAATARLCPEAVLPQETALPATDRAEALPRRYILCERDGTILPHAQEAMTSGWPAAHVTRMDTSHSPFLADPEGLARNILRHLDD